MNEANVRRDFHNERIQAMNDETMTTDSDETVTAVAPEPTEATPVEADEATEKPKTHTRAGFTTNKGHGTPKAKRRMAAQSRRRNRK